MRLRSVNILPLLLASAGYLVAAPSSFEAERSFQADRKKYEETVNRLFRENIGDADDKFTKMAIQMASEWSGINENYQVSILSGAHQKLLESPAPKGAYQSNQIFLASLLIPKLANVPPELSMMVMNNLWGTLTTQGRGESGEDWNARRKESLEAWFRTVDRAKAEFKPEFIGLYSLSNVSPPPGSRLTPGSSPEAEPDPILREKYSESINQNRLVHEKIQRARRISEDLPKFEQRAESLAVMLYSKPPYALVELQEILDRRVSDERATNIMNAVFRALPKAVAATLPRPIPHVGDANRVNQTTGGTSTPGLPAVARPSKIRDGFNQRPTQGAVAPGSSEAATTGAESPGGGAGSSGGRPVWPWALLGLAALAGGWVWVKSRG